MMAEQASLLYFRTICALRMFVYICESMEHRTMEILEGQKHAQCVSVALLKKVEFLILLKDILPWRLITPEHRVGIL